MLTPPANRKIFCLLFDQRAAVRFASIAKWRFVVLWSLSFTLSIVTAETATAGDRKAVYFYAAASMQPALADVLPLASDELSLEVVPVYGGSAALARQIAQGAPAALFLSANSRWVDYLSDNYPGLIGDNKPLLRNRLAFVASPCMLEWPKEPSLRGTVPMLRQTLAKALQTGEKFALGTPDSVPAGEYARQSLQAVGQWDAVAGQAVYAENVVVALNWVANCDVGFGFVYESDARAGRELGVRHVSAIPSRLHEPVIYPLAYIHNPQPDEARRLGAFLRTPQAGKIFVSHGFMLVE